MYGIGAIVDFPNNEALMTCGLDVWPEAIDACPPEFLIVEERLQKRLMVDEFRLPPDYRVQAKGVNLPGMKIPFVIFPRWHYCPRCGAMEMLGLFGEPQRCDGFTFSKGQACNTLQLKRRPKLIPVRFVAVCAEYGHIQDFPFMEWVHGKSNITAECRLRFSSGRSVASLAGVEIICTCGKTRTMAFSFNEGALSKIGIKCSGLRPWLGEFEATSENCGHELRVVQRGASNVYFPHVLSSIYLPVWAEKSKRPVIEIIETKHLWERLKNSAQNGKINLTECELICSIKNMHGLSAAELQNAAQRRLDGDLKWTELENSPDIDNKYYDEEVFRHAEYEALCEGRGNVESDLYSINIPTQKYDDPIYSYCSSITLVHKLKETRAFYGFTRLYSENSQSMIDKQKDLKKNESINWLPAIVVKGEGIFFEFSEFKIAQWLEYAAVSGRISKLIDNYERICNMRSMTHRKINPRFIMLHTLAHLLINQLSYECGYGSSALRERIYCNNEIREKTMNGILIYTATGDSEGSLGGLVRQGQPGRIEPIFIRALKKAVWCSYDPVCMESRGQGPDSCNLAACHGCAITPETSCEEANRLLDRSMVVGKPDDQNIGLFGAYIQNIFSKYSI